MSGFLQVNSIFFIVKSMKFNIMEFDKISIYHKNSMRIHKVEA